MKKFIKKIIIFNIPILLITLPVILILKGTGENFTPIEETLINKKKYLIGYAYNENNYKHIKWKFIQESNKKEILALGSSRVLQFRENMFDTSFYNGGFTISSIANFLPFLKSIPENKLPNILLVGLDQWMFNKNWDDLSEIKKVVHWQNSFSSSPSPNTAISVYEDVFEENYDFSVIFNNDRITKIGLNAIVNNKGMRSDGSMFYGSKIEKLLNNDSIRGDYNYADTFNRIKNGNRRFEYANNVNPKAIDMLDEFLNFCSKNKIYVIGILPPFANEVYQKMIDTNKYRYLNDIYPKANACFNKYDFELWNLINIKDYGSSDKETLDGFHGSELTYLKMLIYMAENHSKLKEYININDLKNDKNNRLNNYTVYDY